MQNNVVKMNKNKQMITLSNSPHQLDAETMSIHDVRRISPAADFP